jgi:hypothetical protein
MTGVVVVLGNGQVSGSGSKTGRGPAVAAALAALLCVLSPVPLQMLEHGWYGWDGITYTWYLPLSGLILFVAAVLTLRAGSGPSESG